MQSKNIILVPTDFSSKSILALDQAIALGKKNKSEIMLLFVIPNDTRTFGFITGLFTAEENELIHQRVEKEIWSKLDELIDSKKDCGLDIKAMISRGKPYDKIVEIAESLNVQYIVIGSNGAEINVKDGFLGSNASRIIKTSNVPVITVSNTIAKEIKTIILPLDLTKQTQQKVAKAIQFARIHNAKIKVVSALLTDDSTIINQLTIQMNVVHKFISQHYDNCTADFIFGDKDKDTLANLLMKFAIDKNGDIMVIMTQQETKLMKFFIGTTAMDIVFNSSIPVLSITPKELNLTSYR
jgi:nucleotide-binding universal stress UspA family protein